MGEEFDDILDELAAENAAMKAAGIENQKAPAAKPASSMPAEPDEDESEDEGEQENKKP